MSARASALDRLLEFWDGQVVAPICLEAAIAQAGEASNETISHLLAAARADLGDVAGALANLPRLTGEELLVLSRRLGWTINALAGWSPSRDRSGLRLEALLASAEMWGNDIWGAAWPRIGNRRVLMAALAAVISRRAPQATVPVDTPTWEREHLEALYEAERACGWFVVAERAGAFTRLPNQDPCAAQATVALSMLDLLCLIRLADGVDGWLRGHMLLGPLRLVDALRLATATASAHVRFAALERVARREARALSPEEETALRNLLIALSKDREGWPHLLAFVNRFPVRYPHMQVALGRALARCDCDALRAYVDSISLSGTSADGVRVCVTRCLAEFRLRADPERRHALWRSAYDRWSAWNYGASEKKGLNEVAWSALDYGAVGWLVEGGPRASLQDHQRTFDEGLRAWDAKWHASSTEACTGFLRLVSRHQVLAHAASCSPTDPDWLPGPTVNVPPGAADPFVQRRYRWGGC